MMSLIAQMKAWKSVPGQAGIDILFVDGGPAGDPLAPGVGWNFCSACHWKTSIDAAPEGGATRFNTCSNCHSRHARGNPLMVPPEWLDFSKKENLMRASYYLAGKNKAEASLLRAIDGSMPPGAAYHSIGDMGNGVQVGWCDEIQDAFQRWIDAGFP